MRLRRREPRPQVSVEETRRLIAKMRKLAEQMNEATDKLAEMYGVEGRPR